MTWTDLPEPPDGMVWLRLAVPVPEPEGPFAALPVKVRWQLDAEMREALRSAYDEAAGVLHATAPEFGEAAP